MALHRFFFVSFIVLLLSCGPKFIGNQGGGPEGFPGWDGRYPTTRTQVVIEHIHGERIADSYRWLEMGTDTGVQKWAAEQDQLTRSILARSPARSGFKKRLTEIAYVDAVSTPMRYGTRLFYARRPRDKEKDLWYWRDGDAGAEHLVLDLNDEKQFPQQSLGIFVPDQQGRRVAFTLKPNNADASTLYILDTKTGERSPVDVIGGAKYANPQWTPDGSGFYYTALPTDPSIPATELSARAEIRFHQIGQPATKDALIYPATGDASRFLSVQLSRDGRWLIVYSSHGWLGEDVYFRDLRRPQSTFSTLIKHKDARFRIAIWKDVFYVLTNLDAPKSRVMRIDPTRPHDVARWKELIPESADATITNMRLVGNQLAVSRLRNAVSEIHLYGLDGRLARVVQLPEIGSAGSVIGTEDHPIAYFAFSSMLTPETVFSLSVPSGAIKAWEQASTPVDPTPFTMKQVWYPSKDGTKVSMFVVHRKDIALDGTHPTLLYGYGGFNVSLRPYFEPMIYPWLESGGVYAMANLRGGGEYGEAWHRAGMLGTKQNVFNDFIAGAEFLISSGYTSADRLAINGRSNGGLLVGAAITQRPDLFAAAICGVPLLDMVRYHKFGSGPTWVSEYGDPEKEAEFRPILAYSPYQRVAPNKRYPATLFLSSDSDDRVDPLHARKMTAALQAAQTSTAAILLRVEKNAGHTGADARQQRVEEWSDVYTFLKWQLNL